MFSVLSSFGRALLEGIAFLLSYVSSGKAFLQPLSKAEEKKYLKRLEQGDSKARDILIKRNMRLVAHIVKKYKGSNKTTQDLISIGTIGLIKAVNNFKLDKNTKLATYAARCIENEILMHLRKTKKLQQEKMIYDPIGSDKEGNEISLIDILGTSADIVSKEVELMLDEEKLYKRLKNLSEREQEVLKLRYGLKNRKKKTQQKIADKLNISRSYVSRIEKKAINKLIKEFQK